MRCFGNWLELIRASVAGQGIAGSRSDVLVVEADVVVIESEDVVGLPAINFFKRANGVIVSSV